jgi:hypothetical protein
MGYWVWYQSWRPGEPWLLVNECESLQQKKKLNWDERNLGGGLDGVGGVHWQLVPCHEHESPTSGFFTECNHSAFQGSLKSCRVFRKVSCQTCRAGPTILRIHYPTCHGVLHTLLIQPHRLLPPAWTLHSAGHRSPTGRDPSS